MLASTLLAAKAGGKVPAGARRGGMTSAWMKVGSKVEQLPSLERSILLPPQAATWRWA